MLIMSIIFPSSCLFIMRNISFWQLLSRLYASVVCYPCSECNNAVRSTWRNVCVLGRNNPLFCSMKILSNDVLHNARAFIVMFYALNPLHADVLQWAFVQSVLLGQMVMIIALIFLLRYLREGCFIQLGSGQQ